MTSREFELTHDINPVTEMMPPEGFTDREDILLYLEEWFKNIANRRSGSKAEIEDGVGWELQHGVIGGFWSSHFANYESVINDDPEPGIGKRIIYYLLKYQGREVPEKEIADSLGVSPEVVTRKLQKLSEADIVERTGLFSYQGLTDKMLARYIYQTYGQYVDEVDRRRVRPPAPESFSRSEPERGTNG